MIDYFIKVQPFLSHFYNHRQHLIMKIILIFINRQNETNRPLILVIYFIFNCVSIINFIVHFPEPT